jgi:4-hydroxy-2-oxovalerate aldolase
MKILECTLRDGSYAVNFQFTARDTSVICESLDRLGFELIEVGHGVGLGASEKGYGVAVETDEAYLKAAAESVRRAKFGMFCIPGIATVEHIDLAASHGMGFVRIGTNVTEVEQSKPFIERAKKHGMMACANFMKSYALSPAEFAEKVKLSASYGADVVYLVDSAGGMLPEHVASYVTAVKSVSDVRMGFHGHDNLGLAVANSLRAVECGAEIVDTSLQGLGRSAGNAPTELMVAALQRAGRALAIDPIELMDVGEAYIKPLIRRQGLSSIDVVSGLAQFHSSYMNVISRAASQFRVDPRRLIMGVCERDKVNAPEALVEEVARSLKKDNNLIPSRFALHNYHGDEQRERT